MPFTEAVFGYEALIFDLDGTLVNSMPWHIKAWQQVCRENGFEISEKFLYDNGGLSGADVAELLIAQGNRIDNVAEFLDRKSSLYRQNITKVSAFPGIMRLLKEGVKRGLKIAVGSGTKRQNGEEVLKLLNLWDCISVLVASEDVVRHKPHPDTFLKAAEKIGVAAKNCLVFEDGVLGLKAAKSAGMDCIFVNNDRQISFMLQPRQ